MNAFHELKAKEEEKVAAFEAPFILILHSFFLCYCCKGFELSFYSGVYSNAIGFTVQFGKSAKQLVGLSGICIGIGEISGGVLFGLLGSRTIKYGRDPIVIVGFLVHVLSFLLIYLNLPNDAPCE